MADESHFSDNAARSVAICTLPKVGFSYILASAMRAAISERISQPSVPLIQ